MSSRATFRRKIVLPVTVIRHGGQERQLAHTLDLTTNSARLGGLTSMLEAGEIIEVQRGALKAKFQVVWMGSQGGAMTGQAGIRGLNPDRCIWSADMPEDETDLTPNTAYLRRTVPPVQTSKELPGERRWHPRYTCAGTASIKSAGSLFAINGEVKDVSKGGVYIELKAPLPVNSQVSMSLHVEDISFDAAGLVRTSYPFLGMGICLQNLTPEDTEKLAVAVERARRRSAEREQLTSMPDQRTGDSETIQADVLASTSAESEDNTARTLVKLCRKLAEDFDRWKLTCSAAEIAEAKQAIHDLSRKFSPARGDGFIEYLTAPDQPIA